MVVDYERRSPRAAIAGRLLPHIAPHCYGPDSGEWVQKWIISTLQRPCNSLLQLLTWAMNAQAVTFLIKPIRSSLDGFIEQVQSRHIIPRDLGRLIEETQFIRLTDKAVHAPLGDETQWLNGYHLVVSPHSS